MYEKDFRNGGSLVIGVSPACPPLLPFHPGRNTPEGAEDLPSHPAKLQAGESSINLWEFTDLANYGRVDMHGFQNSLNF